METEIVEVKKSDRGFTLVELLIVIVILGILATVTVFAVRGITNQGQKSACDADNKTMSVAAEAYFAQYGGTAIPIDPALPPANASVAYAAAGTGDTAAETLENAGLLRDVSEKNWTLNADGSLTATPLGPCVAP